MYSVPTSADMLAHIELFSRPDPAESIHNLYKLPRIKKAIDRTIADERTGPNTAMTLATVNSGKWQAVCPTRTTCSPLSAYALYC
mmetsp:Transcript_34221/g.102420  ORF Transcript_34221/g.102420 Transcript_34221/m.102420 type:complete len:85 (+) Transcript_34221:725-979(+)